MAAGLGTRMRSDVPKHLHPILGRRMVDWVLEASRGLGADPLVVVAAPATAGAFDGLAVAVQEEPRGTGTRCAARARALEGRADDVLVLSGDTPLLTSELLRELVETTGARDARQPSSRSSRTTRARTGASSAASDGSARRDRRVSRRDRGAASGARGQLVHLRVPGS